MNLQHERTALLCQTLSLPCVAQGYGAAAQHAAKTSMGYGDFLKGLLKEEAAGRKVCKANHDDASFRLSCHQNPERTSVITLPKASREVSSRIWLAWALSTAMKTSC